jgi:hypothetical protein
MIFAVDSRAGGSEDYRRLVERVSRDLQPGAPGQEATL